MSYEDRKKASWGKDRMLYCQTCMTEQEVYSASGHQKDERNMHCVRCTNFVARFVFDGKKWDLDHTVYGDKKDE